MESYPIEDSFQPESEIHDDLQAGNAKQLTRHSPAQLESEITSPLNTVLKLLSPDDLVIRNRALMSTRRRQSKLPPNNIIVN